MCLTPVLPTEFFRMNSRISIRAGVNYDYNYKKITNDVIINKNSD